MIAANITARQNITKVITMMVIMLMAITSSATTYYFSASGNDANNGTSTATPWQTIAKFNSFFPSFLPGDHVLFNSGDIFYGVLKPTKSFTVGSPLVIGSYGTGAKPVITGFVTVSAWTSIGGNIWESTAAISTLSYTNMVAINGVNTEMGRTPNNGAYYSFQSHSGTTQITSSNLTGTPNWTGADVAMNLTTGRIVKNRITSQATHTINFVSDPEGAGIQNDNQRFIIQNDIRTLDAPGEWYYNPGTHKIDVYSVGAPTGVQVATLDSLVLLTGRNYITFDGLSFTGANTSGTQVNHSTDITVQNCDFNYMGRNAVFGSKTGSSLRCVLQNNTVNHCNDNGFDLPKVDFDFAIVQNNNIKNCGVLYGMMDRNDGINNNATAQGMSIIGANCMIQNNIVDSVGYIGIHQFGSNTTVQNNFIMDYCLLNNDGGAIYSWNGASKTVQAGIRILNNITVNRNTSSGVNTADYGIYLDDLTNNVEVAGNTCLSSGWGSELHNVFKINFHDNTFYNNSMAPITLTSDAGAGFVTGHTNMDSITIQNNIFFAKTATQKTFWVYAKITPLLPPHLVADTNYFARPIDNNGASILTNFNDATVTNRNLPNWQSFSAADVHSGTTPKAVTSTDSLLVLYNATPIIITIPLSYNYEDVRGIQYNGTITLRPFKSAVLIQNGAVTGGNIPPVANAGTDSTIRLPQSQVHLLGSGTDADGTIAAYLWTKVSGPGTTTILTPTSQNAIATNLQAGTYVFQLRVTDNLGATGTDNVTVVVNAANIPPTANAGVDQSITLPTSTATLTGTDSDPDGTISSRAWTQLSGPNTATMSASTSATNGLSGLIQGTYIFQYTVTDNQGATASDNMQLIVNPAGNVPPTADAGVDQFVATSSTTLTGMGTDTDGTIASYGWTLVSGPNTPTIVSASSASTSVTGMITGVYTFRLTVTDNMGATASAIVHVTVTLTGPTINLIILHGKIKIL